MNFLSIKKWSIIILLVANAIVLNCTTADTALSPTSNEADETKNIEPVVVEKEKENTPSYNEQIDCKPQECIRVEYDKYSELDGKIYNLMGENAGKFLIKMLSYDNKLNHADLEPTVDYLREISKKEGRVSIEPYYIGHRDGLLSEIPFVKDIGLLGWDVYGRVRDTIKYRNAKNYNAKVLYHPKYNTIMMIFFVHKKYGDVCNTVYSNCKEIEYLDDDTFDLSLSTALKETAKTGQSVKVHFRQVNANLPDATLDLENIKKLNQSSRLFKWLVLTKKTEKKTAKRERFIGIETAITVLDYSLKLYDAIQKYKIYSPALNTRAEIVYVGNESGGEIKSVVFYHEKK